VIAVLSAVVIAITGLRTYSVVSYLQDRKEYEKAGYLNLVDSNGFKMNVYSTGAEHGRHTIVGLAGQASYAFPVETTELNELLGKENTLVYPDRAGYGFSGDSLKPRTVEQIVEDYRTGLKNAGFEAPYVLMAHSIADFYALYWEMQYPDEVEAIVILDGSIPPKNELWQTYTVEEEFPSEDAGRTAMRRLVLNTWLGMNRLFPDSASDGGATQGAATFSDEQLRLSKLCNNRFWTAAFASEILLEKQEVTHMGEILHPTDTPKLYFSTLYTCEADVRASLERMKADHEAEGKAFNIDPETAARAEWKQIEWEIEQAQTEEDDFMDKIGNCRLESVAGDHGIFYAQEPEQIASSILGFLAETTE
jgi:pimeloyl-ACP methyl ester carboxylesterase